MKSGRTNLTIVLAAGEGIADALRRCRSAASGRRRRCFAMCLPPHRAVKVRLCCCGRPDHQARGRRGHRARPDAQTFVQTERRGTAHAWLARARPLPAQMISWWCSVIRRYCSADTFARLRAPLKDGPSALVVLGFRAADPTGYGRLVGEGRRTRRDPRAGPIASAEREKDHAFAMRHHAFDGRLALKILR